MILCNNIFYACLRELNSVNWWINEYNEYIDRYIANLVLCKIEYTPAFNTMFGRYWSKVKQ